MEAVERYSNRKTREHKLELLQNEFRDKLNNLKAQKKEMEELLLKYEQDVLTRESRSKVYREVLLNLLASAEELLNHFYYYYLFLLFLFSSNLISFVLYLFLALFCLPYRWTKKIWNLTYCPGKF